MPIKMDIKQPTQIDKLQKKIQNKFLKRNYDKSKLSKWYKFTVLYKQLFVAS